MSRSLLGLYAISLGATPLLVGTLYALSSTVALLTRIPIAILSDRYGSRPFILAGQFLLTFPSVLYLLARDPTILLVAQFIGGLGGSCFLSQMYSFTTRKFLSNNANGAKGREFIGYAVTGTTVAQLVCPGFASIILLLGGTFHQVFMVATLLGFLGLVLAFCVIRGEVVTEPKDIAKSGIRNVFSLAFLLLLISKTVCEYGTKGVKGSFVPLYANEKLGFAIAEVPLLSTISAIPSVIARLVAGKIKKSHPTILALACTIVSASFLLIIGSSHNIPWLIWVFMIINGFADGLFIPTSVTYAAEIVPDHHRSLGMALLTIGLDLGNAAGSFVSGNIIALGGGYEGIFIVTALITFSGIIVKLRTR